MNCQAFSVKAPRGKLSSILTDVTLSTPSGQSACITAIWDTGASSSCLSKRAARLLHLAPLGMSVVFTANGRVNCFDYLVDVTLPGGICIKGVRCHEFSGDPVVDMLVGMDIICMGDFAITNAQGVTLMSYRLPPASRHTDYTQPTS